MSGRSTQLGLWGEEQVEQYLLAQGASILHRRWRARYGEIDLIAAWDGMLCLVEVKLRKDDTLATAREFVTPRKQEKLRKTALCYLAEQESALQPRFDIAEVYAPYGEQTPHPRIIYWDNAF